MPVAARDDVLESSPVQPAQPSGGGQRVRKVVGSRRRRDVEQRPLDGGDGDPSAPGDDARVELPRPVDGDAVATAPAARGPSRARCGAPVSSGPTTRRRFDD
jgi:hypothetical protein